jgi:hypothetical protein
LKKKSAFIENNLIKFARVSSLNYCWNDKGITVKAINLDQSNHHLANQLASPVHFASLSILCKNVEPMF